jgi:Chaperone of endosialidase
MAGFDSSGNYTRFYSWMADAAAGTKIRADRHDDEDNGFASGLSQCITKTGVSVITADIPFNGKKITNLGAPVNPTDAANKAYVDGFHTFSTGISLSGAGVNTRLEYPAADMSFLVRSIGDPATTTVPRFIWNDKADGTGTDIMALSDTGKLAVGMTLPVVGNSSIYTPGVLTIAGPSTTIGFNSHISSGAWKAINAGYAGYLTYANGTLNYLSSDVSLAVDGALTGFGTAMSLTPLGNMTLAGSLTAAGGGITTATNLVSSANALVMATTGSGTIYFRPQGPGSTAGQVTINASGAVVSPSTLNGAGGVSAGLAALSGGNITLNNAPPTRVYLQVNGATKSTYYATGGSVAVDNSVSANTWQLRDDNVFIAITGNCAKPGGGPWIDSSDARIKTVHGDYTTGLAAVQGLRPITYVFKGNDTLEPPSNDVFAAAKRAEDENLDRSAPVVPYANSPHYGQARDQTAFVGMIAQEVEQVMPAMVTRRAGYIDGEATEILDLDTTNLIYALVNAVKELAARVEALEAT